MPCGSGLEDEAPSSSLIGTDAESQLVMPGVEPTARMARHITLGTGWPLSKSINRPVSFPMPWLWNVSSRASPSFSVTFLMSPSRLSIAVMVHSPAANTRRKVSPVTCPETNPPLPRLAYTTGVLA